jgi:hypothetical protein
MSLISFIPFLLWGYFLHCGVKKNKRKPHNVALVRMSCPEHNLKTLGDNLLKLHTVVEGIEGECSVKEP